MRQQFISAINEYKSAFGIELTAEKIERLADYYDLIQEHNEFLHLVGPCSPEEFAIRHILESLVLLEYLPTGAKFADIGAGAGLPSIPCLLVRDDLRAVLIESKEKKAGFLQTALAKCELADRAEIANKQFSEVNKCDFPLVTCRALDKFSGKLPQLLKWSGKRNLVLFGGPTLQVALIKLAIEFSQHLLPLSERRFIFVVANNTG